MLQNSDSLEIEIQISVLSASKAKLTILSLWDWRTIFYHVQGGPWRRDVFLGLVRTFSKDWCKMKPLHLLWGSWTESRNDLNQTSNFIPHTPHLSASLTKLFCYNVPFSLSSIQYTGWSHIIRAWLGTVGKHRLIACGTFFFFFYFFLFLFLIFVFVFFRFCFVYCAADGGAFRRSSVFVVKSSYKGI